MSRERVMSVPLVREHRARGASSHLGLPNPDNHPERVATGTLSLLLSKNARACVSVQYVCVCLLVYFHRNPFIALPENNSQLKELQSVGKGLSQFTQGDLCKRTGSVRDMFGLKL